MSDSKQRAESTMASLSQVVGPLPAHLTNSDYPASALLHDPEAASTISAHLRQPNSGAGDDNLCRWLYDTFQSSDPALQLIVLRFLPVVAELYLSRCTAHRHFQPLAGFEAVLLALYAHETVARDGNPSIVSIPYNVSTVQNSYYREEGKQPKGSSKNTVEEAKSTTIAAVISSALEPHGTVRATKRARIVGVALELYYAKIALMPIQSKVEFCNVALAWAGACNDNTKAEEERSEKGERIPLPWELLVPTLRIVGHCLLRQQPGSGGELKRSALEAVKGLEDRAMHDMNTQAILATRSLVRLGMMGDEDVIEPKIDSVYSQPALDSADSTMAANRKFLLKMQSTPCLNLHIKQSTIILLIPTTVTILPVNRIV